MRWGAAAISAWWLLAGPVPCSAQAASASAPRVASPPHHAASLHHHAHAHRHRHIAHPPAPRAPPPPGQTAAPVPDENLEPPREALHAGVNVVPGNLQLHFPPAGNGYLPNSSSETLDDTRTPKVPGLTLTVPLGAPDQSGPP